MGSLQRTLLSSIYMHYQLPCTTCYGCMFCHVCAPWSSSLSCHAPLIQVLSRGSIDGSYAIITQTATFPPNLQWVYCSRFSLTRQYKCPGHTLFPSCKCLITNGQIGPYVTDLQRLPIQLSLISYCMNRIQWWHHTIIKVPGLLLCGLAPLWCSLVYHSQDCTLLCLTVVIKTPHWDMQPARPSLSQNWLL